MPDSLPREYKSTRTITFYLVSVLAEENHLQRAIDSPLIIDIMLHINTDPEGLQSVSTSSLLSIGNFVQRLDQVAQVLLMPRMPWHRPSLGLG